MKIASFFNIEWDTTSEDNSEDDVSPPDLPTYCQLEVDDDTDLDEEGADILSEEYGFCVFNFEWNQRPVISNVP